MKRVLTFAGIGCGGLLALLVLFVACSAILGGGGDDKDTASSGDGGGKKGSNSKQKAEEETVAIGQPLAVGDVQWTVTDARMANELVPPGISPKNAKSEQGNFVVVDFTFE